MSAGYGNRTAPDYKPESLAEEHSNTRLGLADSYSSPTYGSGFGNKRASQPTISPSSSNDTETGTESSEPVPRFDTQGRHGSAPYSNAHTYGSASTAGSGWGNKTASSSSEGEGEGKKDSVVGKVMMTVGGLTHSSALLEKGHAKRASGGDADAPVVVD